MYKVKVKEGKPPTMTMVYIQTETKLLHVSDLGVSPETAPLHWVLVTTPSGGTYSLEVDTRAAALDFISLVTSNLKYSKTSALVYRHKSNKLDLA